MANELNNAILYSCESLENRAVEQFVEFHSLLFIRSGTIQFKRVDDSQLFGAGSIILVKRNQLVKTIKTPPIGGKFESITLFFRQELLRQYSIQRGVYAAHPFSGPTCPELPTNAFLASFFNSLTPYLDSPVPAESALADLKCKEALELTLIARPDLSSLLLDFSDPYKVDLEAFMVRHFRFNVSIDAFAHMSGRSRAGFKRDFDKMFHCTPGHWLKEKRLEEAYHLIHHKRLNPSVVYLEVGFENLSHFSYAFKQRFGIAPSLLHSNSSQ